MKAKLGSGSRFKALKSKLASKGATNPGALAAYIGRKKYGVKKMTKLAATGRSKSKKKFNNGAFQSARKAHFKLSKGQ